MAAAVTKVHPQFSDENIIYMDGPNDYESSVPFGGAYYVGGMLKNMDRLLEFPSLLRIGAEFSATCGRDESAAPRVCPFPKKLLTCKKSC